MQTLTIPEIAARLRVSVKTVRDRYVQAPGFPLPVLAPSPRKRLWLASEVDAWATPAERKLTPQTLDSRHGARG
jgi:predicted DNA-binding transcriptional regulator AlpA